MRNGCCAISFPKVGASGSSYVETNEENEIWILSDDVAMSRRACLCFRLNDAVGGRGRLLTARCGGRLED